MYPLDNRNRGITKHNVRVIRDPDQLFERLGWRGMEGAVEGGKR